MEQAQETNMPSQDDLLQRVEGLEAAMAAQTATLAGAQATQAAAQAGMTATGAATQAGNMSTMAAMQAGNMATMIAGQRFFLRAFQNGPLGARVDKILRPDPADLSDEALATHCKRMVKTNYHPAGTCRMGPDGDPLAVLDAQMQVRGIGNLRVADMSVCPTINAGNTAAPAMMLGDRCAQFIIGEQMAERVHHVA